MQWKQEQVIVAGFSTTKKMALPFGIYLQLHPSKITLAKPLNLLGTQIFSFSCNSSINFISHIFACVCLVILIQQSCIISQFNFWYFHVLIVDYLYLLIVPIIFSLVVLTLRFIGRIERAISGMKYYKQIKGKSNDVQGYDVIVRKMTL